MDFKALFTDDEAVSPVIGVILMVAITVILAAVIASFVLGLGQSAGNNAPSASFDIEYSSGDDLGSSSPWDTYSEDGVVSITHQSGATIPAQELYIKGDSIETVGDGEWQNQANASPTSGSSDVSSGDSVDVEAKSDFTVRVVWQPPEEDTSSTLQEESGPDA